MADVKLCPRCNETKPITEFPKDRSRPLGVFSYCKQCNYSHSRKWVLENKEQASEYLHDYRQKNLEKAREYGRDYSKTRYQQNRELYRQYLRQRRARKRGGVPVTVTQMHNRVKECGNQCVYCGGEYSHIDHVYPISRGGHDVLGNLVPACATCNLTKQTIEWRKWYRRQAFYSAEREQRIEALIKDYIDEYHPTEEIY